MVDFTLPIANQIISHTWMTKIQETIKGEEKRSAIFTWPRVKLKNKLVFSAADKKRYIHTILWRDIHNTWNFPIISDESKLTTAAGAGQSILTVDDTEDRHFYTDRECVLISLTDWELYEVVTISGVDSNTQITISGTLSETWPVGTNVYPYYNCRVESKQSRTSKFYKINEIDILAKESFEELREFSYILPSIDTSVYPIYNSLNLFLNVPLNPITEEYRHPYSLLEAYGLKTAFSTYDNTRIVFDRTFQCNSREDIYNLLDFFDAKQGRFKTFYIPTWMEDIVFTVGFDAAETTLSVRKIYLTEDELVGRHVYIRLKDKSYVCRQITAKPSATFITIDSAIGTTIPTADLPYTLCSFLHEVRFNVDELTIEYIIKDMAKMKVSFNLL